MGKYININIIFLKEKLVKEITLDRYINIVYNK